MTFSISSVIPVYNSERTLPLLIPRLCTVLQETATEFEIILVNDGSRDNSWDVVTQLAAQYDQVIGINLMRNYGQHNALLCGINQARYEVIITLDDDLQNPPEEIPKLVHRLAEGYDVVYGLAESRQYSPLRRLVTHLTKILIEKSTGAKIIGQSSGFRAFRAELQGAFVNYRGPIVEIDVILSWGTTSFNHVNVSHQQRTVGRSNYTLGKLITHTVNVVTGFSVLPLQLASYLGFMFTFAGFLILIYVIGRYLMLGYSVPGFPFLASIIAIFSGVQLFTLGIIGEYLARLYKRGFDQPSYLIRERTTSEQN